MTTTNPEPASLVETLDAVRKRPKRADARRNYDKVIAAAREVFTEGGADASLEEIARRAGVGIGTLYRNFPNRQALLEAVYVEEVEALSRAAIELADQPPWEALDAWLHSFVGYMHTKQALAQELLSYVELDAPVFQSCRGLLYGAGEPLLARAQEAQVVRPDVTFPDMIQMVGGIARIKASDPDQVSRILDVAIDGLRYRP
jgi:AcrR family transcriptional regulator